MATSILLFFAAAIIGGPAMNGIYSGAKPTFSNSFRSLAANNSQSSEEVD